MTMEKTFNAAEAEARIYKKWEESGAFKAGANASKEETFCVMIPPPNVTGALHVGHAFNNTLQDILTRWHRMQGHDTLWQPGQDHAGIATQLQVEKMLAAEGLPGRRDLGREAFLEKVWEWKSKYAYTIIDQLKRLGCSCDWDRNAFTMAGAPGDPRTGHENSADFHDAVIKVFVDMYEKGLIYRGKRLVNWDPHFETAISDLEVENIEVDGHMWHFKYPLAGGATYEYVEKDEDGNVTLRETRDYISIATTRPETMLGDGAVAVHPSDERYAPIVGKLCEIPVGPKEHRRLIPIITDEYPDPDFGSGAVKITGAHDFNDYQVAKRGGIPMYRLMDTRGAMRADGAPYAEAATEAQAIANGAEFTETSVDALNLVPDDLRGLDRFEARAKVVEQITSEGLAVMTVHDDARLGKRKDAPAAEPGPQTDAEVPDQVRDMVALVESKPINQPFGDRSKVVIEPMLTDQWFVDTDKIVGPALDAVKNGDVKIMPESGEKTYYHWLENIEPWCISRQLWWGHQIPVWYAVEASLSNETDGQEIKPENADQANQMARDYAQNRAEIKAERERRLLSRNPRTSLFCAPSVEALRKSIEEKAIAEFGYLEVVFCETVDEACEKTLSSKGFSLCLYRDPDVLDTWFSSGLWPIGTLGWPEETEELKKYFPTNVLITGQDILFFWVARMMMMQQAVVGENPFSHVYLHQLVRDEKGKKMSKTTGNVIDPLEIVDEYGADALRFTNASMAAIGGVLKLSEDRIKGYRNFGTKLWNASRFAEMNGVFHHARYTPSDALTATANKWIVGEVAKTRATVDEALKAFRFNDAASALYAFTYTYCDWYLEFSKPLFDTDAAEETRATMGWALDQMLIMLHPFMPFITEEIWGLSADRAKMLVHADWPEYGAELVDDAAVAEMRWVRDLIEKTRSVRGEMNVPKSVKAPLLKLSLDEAGDTAWANNEAIILKDREAGIAGLEVAETTPKGAATIAVDGGTFALPLAGLIDVDAEKARLEKSLQKLAKELGGLRGRLNNPKFVESAPAEVIEETKANAAAREEEETRLKSALARLEEIS